MNASRILLCCTLVFLLAPAAQTQTAKRPMTFEDMMAMKRLGDTAVSPDGKWLAYSVTTVDLAKNTKTPELWLQKIEGGEPFRIAVAQPGDSGVQFSSDGKEHPLPLRPQRLTADLAGGIRFRHRRHPQPV